MLCISIRSETPTGDPNKRMPVIRRSTRISS